MDNIMIKLIEESDSKELLEFELKNRCYFEKSCLSRGDSYYEVDNFNSIIRELVNGQNEGLYYMYLIKNSLGEIVGRVNLVDIVRGNFNKAELGYRIGEDFIGNGYATKAVALVLDEAVKKHKLHRIEAGTSPENLSSQKVLIKNGFNIIGTYNKYIYLNGSWCDSVLFEKVID